MRKILYILLFFSLSLQSQILIGFLGSGSTPVSYDITSMSYDSKSYDPSTQTGAVLEEGVISNGFLYAGTSGDAYRYTFTDSDISTASYDSNTTTYNTYRNLMWWNATGSALLGATTTGVIYEGSASTDYSLTSISTNGSDDISATIGTNARGWAFNSDGTKLYIANSDTDVIYQYSVSPAYTGAPSYDSKSKDISSNVGQTYGLLVSPDDNLLFVIDNTGDTVKQFSFGTVGDITTLAYDSISISVGTQDSIPYGLFYNGAKDKLILVGYNTDKFYQYSF